MRITHLKLAAIKAAIVLIPSYAVAYVTEQMVWVIPTLAAAGFFASTVGVSQSAITRRLDEDGTVDEGVDATDPDDIGPDDLGPLDSVGN